MDGKTLAGSDDQGAGPSAGVFAANARGSPWNFSCGSALGTVLEKGQYGGILAEYAKFPYTADAHHGTGPMQRKSSG